MFAEAGNDVINLNFSSSSNVSSYGGDGDDTFNIMVIIGIVMVIQEKILLILNPACKILL